MKRIIVAAVCAMTLLGQNLHAEERKLLTPEQQKTFLNTRTHGSMMGTFNSHCSLLFAWQDVAIHTESTEVNNTQLHSVFPDFYKPTWNELFNEIARQTKSSCKYDPKKDFWVFMPPAMPVSFEIDLAEGWQQEDRGSYIFFKPPNARVGMDIYLMGTYSFPEEEKAGYDKVKEQQALHFAKGFKEDIAISDMTSVKIGSLDSLHFKILSEKGVIWRQWIVVDSGMAFGIVSAIKPEHDEQIYPDVEKMLKTFKIRTKKETKLKTPATEAPDQSLAVGEFTITLPAE